MKKITMSELKELVKESPDLIDATIGLIESAQANGYYLNESIEDDNFFFGYMLDEINDDFGLLKGYLE